MKNILLLIIILSLIGVSGYLFLKNNKILSNAVLNPTPTQVVKSTPIQQSNATPTPDHFCTPSQLDATLLPEGAAGNVYTKVTIKNISQTTCKIVGINTLKISYPQSVKNIQTIIKGQPNSSDFTLTPNQTIFSLLHFPNGPQCSSETTRVDAMVSYNISQQDLISFKPTTGTALSVPSCEKTSEITNIDLYPFSINEINP